MVKHLFRCASFALFVLLCAPDANAQGRKLPSTEVKALNGKRVDVSTLTNHGKPTIVLVWEITCAPCLTEFNSIARVYSDWQKETGVKIIAISVDDNRSSPRVAPMARSKGWAWDTYLDVNQDFKRAMNVPLCPFAFVLDAKGDVVWQKGGYVPGDEIVLYDVVKKVAAGQSPE
jgi:cytochrome c biogenesis protein CcmG/thiol:disulfide interchange protein DsbE